MATKSTVSNINCDNYLKNLMRTLTSGQISEEEYFCLVLSQLGELETKFSFMKIVETLSLKHPELHKKMLELYVTMFSGENSDSVLNPSSSLEEDLHLELAIQLSTHAAGEFGVNSSESNWRTAEKTNEGVPSATNYGTSSWSTVINTQSDKNTCHHGPQNTQHSSLRSSTILSLSNPKGEGGRKTGVTELVQLTSGNKKKSKRRNRVERPILQKPIILWFRRDLRIFDNPALIEACRVGGPVIPVFLWSEVEEGPLAAGGATKVWLHHALKSLNHCLMNTYNCRLLYFKTKSCRQELISLAQSVNAATVIWNDLHEPWLRQRDDFISESLERKSVAVKRFQSYCLHDPYSISTDSVGWRGIGSVSHFMACAKMSSDAAIPLPVDPPTVMKLTDQWPNSQSLDELELDKMPQRKDGSIVSQYYIHCLFGYFGFVNKSLTDVYRRKLGSY